MSARKEEIWWERDKGLEFDKYEERAKEKKFVKTRKDVKRGGCKGGR